MTDVPIGNGLFMFGDCLERMRELPAASVDMILTSPPYDDLRSYNNGAAWTWEIFVAVAAECERLLRPGGACVWVVGDATVSGSETGSSFRQALYFKDVLGLLLHDTMIWDKGGFSAVGSLATRYGPVFEYMFVLTKGRLKTFSPIKDRPNKHAGATVHGTVKDRHGVSRPVSGENKKRISDYGQRFNIWTIPPQRQVGGHPAPFPVSLAQDHVVSWSAPGDTILDPFAGSGTTAIAAERSGRRWICIERDPEYYAKALARVYEAVTA